MKKSSIFCWGAIIGGIVAYLNHDAISETVNEIKVQVEKSKKNNEAECDDYEF